MDWNASPKSAKDSRILIQHTCIQMVFCSNMNLVTVLDFNKQVLEEMNDKSAHHVHISKKKLDEWNFCAAASVQGVIEILSRSMNNINGSQSLERLKLVEAKKAGRKLEVGIIKGRCTGDTDMVMGASRRMEKDM